MLFSGAYAISGVFTNDFRFFTPEDLDLEYNLGEDKLLINSVRSDSPVMRTIVPVI
jgi:hypothetical protein